MKKKYYFLFPLLLFFPVLAWAQSSGCIPEPYLVPCGGPGCPCTLCHLFVMINRIVKLLLGKIIPVVAALMLVVAGVIMISSYVGEGGAEGINRAKRLIGSVLIGMLIIYTAWLLIGIFLQTIGVVDWTGLNTWWVIQCN